MILKQNTAGRDFILGDTSICSNITATVHGHTPMKEVWKQLVLEKDI